MTSSVATQLYNEIDKRDVALFDTLTKVTIHRIFRKITILQCIRGYAQFIPFDVDWCRNVLSIYLDGTQGYLPPFLLQLMNSQCPFDPRKRVYENHILIHFIAVLSLPWARQTKEAMKKTYQVTMDRSQTNTTGFRSIRWHYWGLITTEAVPVTPNPNETIKKRGGSEEEMIEAYPYRQATLAEVSHATMMFYKDKKMCINLEGSAVSDRLDGTPMFVKTLTNPVAAAIAKGGQVSPTRGIAIRTFDERNNIEHILRTGPHTAEKLNKIIRRFYDYVEKHPKEYAAMQGWEVNIHHWQSELSKTSTEPINWEEVD